MKKKVVLFANGWSADNLIPFTQGLTKNLPEKSIDIYAFYSHETYGQGEVERKSQSTVFTLPDIKDYDAAIIFGAGLNFADSIDYIYQKVDEAGIPAISICNEHEGHFNIGVDNYSGMLDLSNHIIDKHNCKDILFIAGSKENTDSNIRLKALCDALDAHGLNKPDIFYSNWEVTPTVDYLNKKYLFQNKLPDAIVCANDHLAISLIIYMDNFGIKIPDDVIFTGFDHLMQGQIFYPSIASVDQHFDEIGEITAKALTDIINDSFKPENIILPCSFFPGESCRCDVQAVSDMVRREYSHEMPSRSQADFVFNVNMGTLEQSILQSSDYDTLAKSFQYVYANGAGPEGNSFFVMLDPNLKEFGHDFDYTPYEFCDTQYMAVGKCNGTVIPCCEIVTKDILPKMDAFDDNMYHIVSIFFHEDMMCGYFVFTNKFDIMKNQRAYDFSNKVNRITFSLKRNLQLNELNHKLSELMEQDTLTHVKNRAAYEKYLKKFEADFNEGENPPFAVVYFDINNLKMVNDMYGHEKGDAYIRNSCRLICNTFKHSPVFRIGGDEFVSIVLAEDYIDRHKLLEDMNEHMKILKSKGSSVPLTERISIAFGMAEYDRTLDEDFASIFKRADEIMYEKKYKMKRDMN